MTCKNHTFIYCIKIIVYVKALVKIIFPEFLLNAFIEKKLLFYAIFLHSAIFELLPVWGVVQRDVTRGTL